MPVLIKVYAGFSKLDGVASEDEIESSLGFMRYDYPEAVYSELQSLYRKALREPQDLQALQVLQVVAEEVLQHHLQHQVRALAKEHFVWVRATPQLPLH
jgi:hypothetical protein